MMEDGRVGTLWGTGEVADTTEAAKGLSQDTPPLRAPQQHFPDQLCVLADVVCPENTPGRLEGRLVGSTMDHCQNHTSFLVDSS